MTDPAAIAGFLGAHPHVHTFHHNGVAQAPVVAVDVHDVEDEDGASDASSDVTELDNEDFPRYFDERNGRLFHSHGILSSYTFPVDGTEWKRLRAIHELLKRVLGSNYDGPVAEVLSRAGTRAVDLCTGTGLWCVVTMEMAREFPSAYFRGFDKVPIMTRYPLDNVHFEIGDVREHLRIADASIDVVHARMSGLSIVDYMPLLRQAARILRPGGIFLAVEWGAYPALHPSHPAAAQPAAELPHTALFCEALNGHVKCVSSCRFSSWICQHVMCSHGAPSLALALPALINTTRAFGTPNTRTHALPIGAPPPGLQPAETLSRIGEVMHRCFNGFLDAAVAGHPTLAEHVDLVKHEINTHPGVVAVWHTVYARKL
ncbi:S-adenosyl-L-methionine-dependent methyltransferase [Peniophora sp. CONT]|nr:S-adenosyl-L-methionine-dependent methyltransferase [Peniophora sp. CONT]